MPESVKDPQVLEGKHSFGSVTDQLTAPVLTKHTPWGWFLGFAIVFGLFMLLQLGMYWTFVQGVGIWGINIPVGWGFAIINFVWWIGIGHAGTLISAILFLLKQDWRTSISRFSESMTLFAVMCAGLFPLLHMGRPWKFFWMFPYPSTNTLWPQFRSPLVWDVFAVSTYFLVSLLFWYIGLIPDLATMRDKSGNKIVKTICGILSMGWRGAVKHWQRHQIAYLLLAGLSTPLVVSVHTVVSFDFAISILPGWHTTIFPPYFVAGAVYSGFAMVLCLAIPVRRFYRFKEFITIRHLDNMAKVMLTMGMVVFYGYMTEVFHGWYSANEYEGFMIWNRMTGPYAVFYWALLFCNGLIPQLLWFKSFRTHTLKLFVVAFIVNIGMWLERFIIVVTSLHRDFIPSSWDMYFPTGWDWIIYVGTIGLFLTLMFVFIRVIPMIPASEMRELIHHKGKH